MKVIQLVKGYTSTEDVVNDMISKAIEAKLMPFDKEDKKSVWRYK